MEWDEEITTQHHHTSTSYKQNIQGKKPGQKNVQGVTPFVTPENREIDLKCWEQLALREVMTRSSCGGPL